MRRFIQLIPLVLLLSSSIRAMTLTDLGDRISYFYLRPTAEEFAILQEEADSHAQELAKANNAAGLLFSVFFYRAAEKNGLSISGKGAISRGAAELAKGSSDLGKYVRDDASVNPTKLDVWWVSYFATGENQYLEKLMQYAGREAPKDNLDETLLIGTATWSFKSNCKQHESIRKFAEACLGDNRYKDRRAYLHECIDYASGDREPSQSTDPTPTPVTPPAGQEARHP